MWVGEVATERGLGVRAGRHDAQSRPAQLSALTEEGGDRVVALVLERLGRHRQHGIVGQQGDDVVDVTALDRVGEARHELALAWELRQR